MQPIISRYTNNGLFVLTDLEDSTHSHQPQDNP